MKLKEMAEANIKKLRKDMKLTQRQLAKLLSVSEWTVLRLEKNLHKPHPILQEKIEKLAKQVKKKSK